MTSRSVPEAAARPDREASPGPVRYVVLTGTTERHAEARAAACAFAPDAELDITLLDLPEGRFPAAWQRVKDAIEDGGRA